MGDLLGSASLLLTLIALLYSLWYPEIIQALEIDVKAHAADRVKDHKRAKGIYSFRALPLAIAALVLTLVFIPDLIRIVGASARHLCRTGLHAFLDYDAASTSLVLVTLSSGLFSAHLISLSRKVRAHVERLDPQT